MLVQLLIFIASAIAAIIASGYLVVAALLFEARAKKTQVVSSELRRIVAARQEHALRSRMQ